MSHKVLKGGTAYEIAGGRTLKGGTGYDISGGRILKGGTGYNISFGVKPLIIYNGGSAFVNCTARFAHTTLVPISPVAYLTYDVNDAKISSNRLQITGQWSRPEYINKDFGCVMLSDVPFSGYSTLCVNYIGTTNPGSRAFIYYGYVENNYIVIEKTSMSEDLDIGATGSLSLDLSGFTSTKVLVISASSKDMYNISDTIPYGVDYTKIWLE